MAKHEHEWHLSYTAKENKKKWRVDYCNKCKKFKRTRVEHEVKPKTIGFYQSPYRE